jgi:hypothetical protein
VKRSDFLMSNFQQQYVIDYISDNPLSLKDPDAAAKNPLY